MDIIAEIEIIVEIETDISQDISVKTSRSTWLSTLHPSSGLFPCLKPCSIRKYKTSNSKPLVLHWITHWQAKEHRVVLLLLVALDSAPLQQPWYWLSWGFGSVCPRVGVSKLVEILASFDSNGISKFSPISGGKLDEFHCSQNVKGVWFPIYWWVSTLLESEPVILK